MKARYLPARPIFLTHFDFTIPYPFLACSGLFTYRPKVSKKWEFTIYLHPYVLHYLLPTFLPTYLHNALCSSSNSAFGSPRAISPAAFVLLWQSFPAYEISNFAKFAAWVLQFLELYVRLLLRSQMGSFFFL
jgi:hypothetical protein